MGTDRVEKGAEEDLKKGLAAELILVPNACPMECNRLSQLRAYRTSEVRGNAYRHPGKYGLLTDTRIAPPFVRPDYRP